MGQNSSRLASYSGESIMPQWPHRQPDQTQAGFEFQLHHVLSDLGHIIFSLWDSDSHLWMVIILHWGGGRRMAWLHGLWPAKLYGALCFAEVLCCYTKLCNNLVKWSTRGKWGMYCHQMGFAQYLSPIPAAPWAPNSSGPRTHGNSGTESKDKEHRWLSQ